MMNFRDFTRIFNQIIADLEAIDASLQRFIPTT